jgi:hypothetical protein
MHFRHKRHVEFLGTSHILRASYYVRFWLQKPSQIATRESRLIRIRTLSSRKPISATGHCLVRSRMSGAVIRYLLSYQSTGISREDVCRTGRRWNCPRCLMPGALRMLIHWEKSWTALFPLIWMKIPNSLAKFPSRATSLDCLAFRLTPLPQSYQALRFAQRFCMVQIMSITKLYDLRRTISVVP